MADGREEREEERKRRELEESGAEPGVAEEAADLDLEKLPPAIRNGDEVRAGLVVAALGRGPVHSIVNEAG